MRMVLHLALGLAALVACAAAHGLPPTPAQAPPGTPEGGLASVDASASESLDAAVATVEDAATDALASAGGTGTGDGGPSTGSTTTSACNEQPPQDFLIRSNFLKGGPDAFQRTVRYRTEQYGFFKGFGRADWNAHAPSFYVVDTTFMGLPVKMHRKVVPALQCVEEEIKHACSEHPYTAHALAGIRFKNTYRGGEITNHIYGIAIDIDPGLNTCCGCVKPWNEAPACQRPAKTEYDRMAMPECWVHVFERFGFYWLGHDVLHDTMHFEFLGDPDHILKSVNSAPIGDASEQRGG
jgi:hypothetical protein